MFVLGIDPGLSRCGYGVVEGCGRSSPGGGGRRPAYRSRLDVPQRLAALQVDLRSLLGEHRPVVMAIERVLFQANARTAIPVAQAAGVAMVEAVAAGCQVVEYSPNQVKQTITGHGGADKRQMERMVQTLLGITMPLRPVDAADAMAVALCHLAHAPLHERVSTRVEGRRAEVSRWPTRLRRGGARDRVVAGAVPRPGAADGAAGEVLVEVAASATG